MKSLSLEELARQLSVVEMLQSLYYGDDEMIMDDATAAHLLLLAEVVAKEDCPGKDIHDIPRTSSGLPASIDLTLVLNPESALSSNGMFQSQGRRLYLSVHIPLRRSPEEDINELPRPKLRLRMPDWLSRSDYAAICTKAALSETASEEEGNSISIIMSAVERINEAALPFVQSTASDPFFSGVSGAMSPSHQPIAPELSSHVLRTWHYLPSLSTKSKRDDLVSYAQTHQPPITGFVLAGKPGLIVLEHPLSPLLSGVLTANTAAVRAASASMDAYWSAIKSRSWADIPASHKKVSERLREVDVPRAFEEMSEITRTAELGGPEAMSGMRGNRNEMGKVADWLQSKGIGGRLEKVLGTEW